MNTDDETDGVTGTDEPEDNSSILPTMPKAEVTVIGPNRVDPKDILSHIDQAGTWLRGYQEPSLLARLTSPGARREAKAFSKAREEVVEQRTAYLREMGSMLTLYVGAQKGAALTTAELGIYKRYTDLQPELFDAMSHATVTFFESVETAVQRLSKIKMPDEMKADEIRLKWEAAQKASAFMVQANVQAMTVLLEEVKRIVQRLSQI